MVLRGVEVAEKEAEACDCECGPSVQEDAFDKQVLLECELWRAIATQEEVTNTLCSSIRAAHLQVLRDTHSLVDADLSPLEKKDLQIRELAVLDEFQQRSQEAVQAIRLERFELEETIRATRNSFAEELLLRKRFFEDERTTTRGGEGQRTRKCKKSSRGGLVRIVHRILVTGITVLLANETLKAARTFESFPKIRGFKRRSEGECDDDQGDDDDIHTLPHIAIPSCGTRDSVMTTSSS